MPITELGICENKEIGLKGKVIERFQKALKQAVTWAYQCDVGFIVVYGGFVDNKLSKDLINLDYVVERSDIEQDGHVAVPMYVIPCKLGRLLGKSWGDVEIMINSDYEESLILFGAMYQDADVMQVLKTEKI